MKNLSLIGLVLFCVVTRGIAQPESLNLEFVTVGYSGNPNDATGYGAVDYVFEIGKYEVNNSQYAAFLNSKAKSDPYDLYNPSFDPRNGITRQGTDGSYSYSVKAGFERRPVSVVSFYDAMRFANWLNNGAVASSETENGSYKLNGVNPSGFSRNPAGKFFIPSENEWYKAAYFHPDNADAPPDNYWLYATRSNLAPVAEPPPGGANSANVNSALGDPYIISDVGAYSSSASYFGTFDQTGNVWEWTEASLLGGRGIRGGSSEDDSSKIASSFRIYDGAGAASEGGHVGFRVARTAVGGIQSPLITQQPKSAEVPLGGRAQFAVIVSPDSEPVSFQWRFNRARIVGATANPLVLASVSMLDFGEYTVDVSNVRGSVLSQSGKLSLFIDSDGDGLTDDYEKGVSRYQIIQGNFTWKEANTDAQSRGGHLGTITSEGEWNSIVSLFGGQLSEKILWLGASDEETEGTWKNVTGEPFVYSRWAVGARDSVDEDYLTIISDGSHWNDASNNEHHQYYLFEIGSYSDPTKADTDGDGFSDFDEINIYQTIPNSSDSTPRPILQGGRHSSFSGYRFTLRGNANSNYQIETSNNCLDWIPYVNVSLTAPSLLVTDPTSSGERQRYYRARKLP